MDLSIVEKIKFNDLGLVPAIAQQHDSGEVLMLAWMNIDSIKKHYKQNKFVIGPALVKSYGAKERRLVMNKN